MSSRVDNKVYKTKIKQDWDAKEGYFQFIELPQELLDEIGWKEGDKVELSVKLGTKGNVILVNKS